MNTQKSRIIGIDVGGTKILLQAFDEKMNLVEEEKVLTEVKKGQMGFTKQLISLIEVYFHPKIKSIGVALPGIIDKKTGVLLKAPHLPVKNLKIKKILSERFKRPVTVDNDGNAFLYAQSQRPILKKYKNLIAIMPGTGLGGAILVEGKMVYGKQGFAGELAHMVIRQEGRLRTFEQNTSGAFIGKIAQELGVKSKFTPYDLTKNSQEAKKVKKHIVQQLGIGLANLNLIFNPQAFVMGGSIYTNCLKDSKKEFQKIIAEHALDQRSPLIFDGDEKYTVARGMAMMSRER